MRQIACMTYTVTALDDVGAIAVETGLDANVVNADANYGEQFWELRGLEKENRLYLESETIENPFGVPRFTVGFTAQTHSPQNSVRRSCVQGERHVFQRFEAELRAGDSFQLEKLVSVVTTRDLPHEQLRMQEERFWTGRSRMA